MARSRFLPLLAHVLLPVAGLLLSCEVQEPIIEAHANPLDAMRYAHTSLTYQNDLYDNWQTPEQSLRRGTGDCEDFALLMLASLRAAGEYGELTIIHLPIGTNHAIVYYGGRYYDPVSGHYGHPPSSWVIIAQYSYSIALLEAQWDEIELLLRYGRVDKNG